MAYHTRPLHIEPSYLIPNISQLRKLESYPIRVFIELVLIESKHIFFRKFSKFYAKPLHLNKKIVMVD